MEHFMKAKVEAGADTGGVQGGHAPPENFTN